ncbi:hypothetical protein CFP56_040751 [Quercus suber]|uniref:Uncharacterized protein n=1 Tax=Quercus suber TaxID=58331 RepID=A0AAW0LLC4_QUESU|nr:hypothetical protein CFP56_23117 [Quercus suber]
MASNRKISRSQPLLPWRRSPLIPLLPSRRTSTTVTQIAGAERFRRRKSSRRAHCFLLWGCAVLCLPEPPPHHTPNHTATQVGGAVRGACKHTGAAVSYDPTGWTTLPSQSPFTIRGRLGIIHTNMKEGRGGKDI